jgi:hypothetical protein
LNLRDVRGFRDTREGQAKIGGRAVFRKPGWSASGEKVRSRSIEQQGLTDRIADVE